MDEYVAGNSGVVALTVYRPLPTEKVADMLSGPNNYINVVTLMFIRSKEEMVAVICFPP